MKTDTKGRTTNFWGIWAGEHDETAELDLREGTTSVLWDEVPNLTTFSTQSALTDALCRTVYPQYSQQVNANFAWSLWALYKRVQPGHFVAMPLHDNYRGERHFSLGVVVGEYRYQPQRMGMHSHRVIWLYKRVPRSILPHDVDAAISGHGPSVTPIYVQDAVELTLLAIERYVTEQEPHAAQAAQATVTP